MSTTRTRTILAAAAITLGAAIGTIGCDTTPTPLTTRSNSHTTTTKAPTTTTTANRTPISCTTPVDDHPEILDTWTTAQIDNLVRVCDHRHMVPDLCEEDEWCAIAEVNDTGDYTGRHTPGTR